MNILYKIVMKFIYKDSKPKQKKRPPYWKAIFWPVWKKQKQKKPNTDLTSDFSFARSFFLSCSTIWMPEIAYISSYKRTSYLSRRLGRSVYVVEILIDKFLVRVSAIDYDMGL